MKILVSSLTALQVPLPQPRRTNDQRRNNLQSSHSTLTMTTHQRMCLPKTTTPHLPSTVKPSFYAGITALDIFHSPTFASWQPKGRYQSDSLLAESHDANHASMAEQPRSRGEPRHSPTRSKRLPNLANAYPSTNLNPHSLDSRDKTILQGAIQSCHYFCRPFQPPLVCAPSGLHHGRGDATRQEGV